MGLFDFFKKKENERHYDALNIKVEDLDKGFIFDFNMKSWEVVEVYEYDWGNNFFTREFKISSHDETGYLGIEMDDELLITFSKKVPVRKIQNDLPDFIQRHDTAPRQLFYEGKNFFLDEISPGYFRNVENENWSEFREWSYEDDSEEYVLTVEQWGEHDFEASFGHYVNLREITNILPSED
ncbi:DUF4178 domain-containing protein [Aureivirga sp. CE67]|uniref:DUF4178 domain-containing protein n=1 Tax=Aureivirga sp. CE67 TaxID=1788983 RepID=UPI0018CA72A1|nr:DUF4178 domain-containing protein [Aureivirga sp. CE67]